MKGGPWMKKYSSATVWIIAFVVLFLAATLLFDGGKSSNKIVVIK